jgi:hypothetical protein
MSARQGRPVARRREVVVKVVGDEVLVYDLERHRAHSLNRMAAAVWRACDGTRGTREIAAELQRIGQPQTEEAVQYALAELSRARLLAAPTSARRLTRRELMRRVGATAAALPVVTSIMVPRAADAQSAACFPPNRNATVPCSPVGTQAQCCGAETECSFNAFSETICCVHAAGLCSSDTDCCPLLSCVSGSCAFP